MNDDLTTLLGAFDSARAHIDERGRMRSFLLDILTVLDSLDRLCPPGTLADTPVALVRVELEDVLARQGVKAVPVLGSAFDPNCQEAAGRRYVPGARAGTVVEEWRRGYSWDGELLRTPLVVVAEDRHGAAAPAPEEQPR